MIWGGERVIIGDAVICGGNGTNTIFGGIGKQYSGYGPRELQQSSRRL